MTAGALIALATVMFVWAVLSARLTRRNLTGPLVLLTAGVVVANPDWGVVTVDVESATVHTLAELTLALLLFADASAVPLATARRDLPITVRLLAIGLPLSIAIGVVLGIALFPTLPVALVGFVAAGLAPTDAALSASVIADERLPGAVRRALNVESGLNDGIATPVVTFFLATAAGVLGIAGHGEAAGWSALGQLAVGTLVGATLGAVGGRILAVAHARDWMEQGARRLATLALAVLSFVVATEIGGNAFVAAFIGGLAFGAVSGRATTKSVEMTELGGDLLSLVLWFVFGAGFVIPALESIGPRVVLYTLCSLTVVRMVPVAIALAGSGVGGATTAYIGWFGPRGLASVVFALLAVEELGYGDPRVMAAVHAVVITVVVSVVAHGVSARPLTARYLRAVTSGRPTGRRRRTGRPAVHSAIWAARVPNT
jgi:NhaP-type Na+/H+ or K+/H+ antiporter